MEDTLKESINQAAAVLKAAGAREVYLFGSSATGHLRNNSDVDMAVTGLPARVFFQAMATAEGVLGRTLDLIDLDTPSLFSDYLRKKGKLIRVA